MRPPCGCSASHAGRGTRDVRIALVRQRYNPFGGAERFVERAIGALEKEGAEITLITRAWKAGAKPGDGGEAGEAGEDAAAGSRRRSRIVNPFHLGRLWRDLGFARGVRALLSREHFDLVQSHERIAGCDLYRAGDGVHRQWLAYRAVTASPLERLGVWLNPWHRYVCAEERAMFGHPKLRAVICNSQMVAGEIRRHFPAAAGKLHVIYNGVDLEHFHPARRAALRDEARARFHCAPEDAVFAFVGSGFARKGLAAAIEALARLQARGPAPVRLLVAGRDRALATFRAQAERAGVAGRVLFTGGLEDVRPVYAAADCFILPTRYDPFPNTALEAMAMGLPAIVSTQCGAAELVRTGDNGWVCAPDDAAALAACMQEAAELAFSPAGQVAGEAARRSAESFGIDMMAEQMVALYRALLGDTMGRAA
jgi:UDP-glucose:(heptosyl)LPS alpha-1,3-glucosyltransferase